MDDLTKLKNDYDLHLIKHEHQMRRKRGYTFVDMLINDDKSAIEAYLNDTESLQDGDALFKLAFSFQNIAIINLILDAYSISKEVANIAINHSLNKNWKDKLQLLGKYGYYNFSKKEEDNE